ncbi:MAG: plastocyanin/azurin family copper-binding protein [Nitrosopumilaceae archaeon]
MKHFLILLIILGTLLPFAYAEEFTVSIPFGAYNPELNTPAAAWYDPAFMSIEVGDTVTWENNDREPHTVTSGQGSGRFGWMSDDYGTPNGLFQSELFAPGESWSFTFSEQGTFPYFCVIHPWMEAAVIVNPSIPDHPVDGFGNKIEGFPIIAYTADGIVELDMTWEPNVIKTNEKVVFIYHTYDPLTNSNLDKMSYDIIIKQNGKEIFRDEGITTVGGDYRNFVFEEPGPVEIKFENVISWGTSGIESEARSQPLHPSLRSVQFSTIVFESLEDGYVPPKIIQPKQTFQLYYEVAVLIIVIPAALLIIVIILMMRGKPLPQYRNPKSSPV